MSAVLSSSTLPSQLRSRSSTISDYCFTHEIGKGGSAKVYAGYHKDCPTYPVAIKVIQKSWMIENEMTERVENEIAIHRKLTHASIVQLIDTMEDTSAHYLILELCSNGDLATQMKDKTVPYPFSEHEAQSIVRQLAQAIAYLHHQSILHRDLKLKNILIQPNYHVKLADFGMSVQLLTSDEIHHTIVGTPNYIAPEIIQEHSSGHGFPADIWSFGCITFTVLTGHAPFQGTKVSETLQNVVQYHYSATLPEFLSPSARDFIHTILQPNPQNRPTIDQILKHPWLSNPSTSYSGHTSEEDVKLSMLHSSLSRKLWPSKHKHRKHKSSRHHKSHPRTTSDSTSHRKSKTSTKKKKKKYLTSDDEDGQEHQAGGYSASEDENMNRKSGKRTEYLSQQKDLVVGSIPSAPISKNTKSKVSSYVVYLHPGDCRTLEATPEEAFATLNLEKSSKNLNQLPIATLHCNPSNDRITYDLNTGKFTYVGVNGRAQDWSHDVSSSVDTPVKKKQLLYAILTSSQHALTEPDQVRIDLPPLISEYPLYEDPRVEPSEHHVTDEEREIENHEPMVEAQPTDLLKSPTASISSSSFHPTTNNSCEKEDSPHSSIYVENLGLGTCLPSGEIQIEFDVLPGKLTCNGASFQAIYRDYEKKEKTIVSLSELHQITVLRPYWHDILQLMDGFQTLKHMI